jgi:carboxymethylenebutenolidase
LFSSRHKPGASLGFYGGRIAHSADEKLRAPVLLHFDPQDAHTPAVEIGRIRRAHPELEIYLYEAGHGFNRDVDASYKQEAALAARERSLAFLKFDLT